VQTHKVETSGSELTNRNSDLIRGLNGASWTPAISSARAETPLAPFSDSTPGRENWRKPMSDQPTEPLNAFTPDYLAAVQERDDPSTSREAETSGPFKLVEQNGMLALYRSWESAVSGDLPLALFHHRETALLFQALWPALGRTDLFRLRPEPSAQGFTLEVGGQIVGSLRSFDPEAVLAGHFLSYLARTPQSLALLVEAAGPTAQRHVGRLLGARVLGER
jgi:hypothetical protein